MTYRRVCLVFITTLLTAVKAQFPSPGDGRTTFYLDSSRDCDGTPREVGGATTMIYGKSTETQGSPSLSCTLTLNTENIREPHRFKIEFLSMYIGEANLFFYVYDGESNGRLRWAFSKDNGVPPNLDFDFTTGQQVTFRLTRGRMDTNYNIALTATPVPSVITDCQYENQYGCDEYNYNYRILGTKEIVGIVGGVFALIIVIVIIVVVCCYRKQRGITKTWKEEKLGHVNTAASLHSLNGKTVSNKEAPASRPWTSESSKNGFASIRRSPNLPRAKIARSSRMGESALSDSNASLPAKRPLPPPQVSYNSRGASRSRDRYRDRDRDSDRSSEVSFSTDKNFSEKTFTSRGLSEKTVSSSRNMRPPTYREVMRRDRSESESSADEHSFVQANDAHPQEVFVEKVIVPRVKTNTMKNRSPKFQRVPPPLEEDTEYDSIEPKKLLKAKMVEKETQDEETEESETENESEEEDSEEDEEEEDSEEEEEDEPKADQADAVYSKPNKSKGDQQNPVPQIPGHQGAFQPPNPQQFQGGPGYPGYLPPGVHQPQPRYGYPGQPPRGPYPQYPPAQQQPGYPPAQPYPQPAPQPGHDPYHQANFTVPLQPRQQLQHQPRPKGNRPPNKSTSREPATQPGQPPIYSYLVNRGYHPINGRQSPVSTSTGASNVSGDRNLQNDDSDFSANLDSGVELMRRKN